MTSEPKRPTVPAGYQIIGEVSVGDAAPFPLYAYTGEGESHAVPHGRFAVRNGGVTCETRLVDGEWKHYLYSGERIKDIKFETKGS
jgi:hypothetical protein